MKPRDMLTYLTQEQNLLNKRRRHQNLVKLGRIHHRSLQKNFRKNYSRRKGRLNFQVQANQLMMLNAKEVPIDKKERKRLKDIILKNRKMFKINKVKRYETEGGKVAQNILRNIQHRLEGRNHFQFQKDVGVLK